MVYVLDAKRTPTGSMQGQLSSFSASDLGSIAIKALACNKEQIEDVYMGCVVQAGVGQNPARQAAIKAFNNENIKAVTVNKVCGSGMQAIAFAVDQINLKRAKHVVAGGMESMTNAPYALLNARSGYRFSHNKLFDLMLNDGLEDSYNFDDKGNKLAMGVLAQIVADNYNLSRQMQEDFVLQTYENAIHAKNNNYLVNEICPITLDGKAGTINILEDEPLLKVKPDKFSNLKPAFAKVGTITAATSSSIADGASALYLSAEKKINNSNAIAKIVDYASYSIKPENFTIAPVFAIKKLLQNINWTIDMVDLFEINEAFAIVPMIAIKDLGIKRDRVNIFGGACVLGHPIGSSGSRIVVSLINALRIKGLKRGIASACIGGGEATAIAIEICD